MKILQIGEQDWTADLELPDKLEWLYCHSYNIESLLEDLEKQEIEKILAKLPEPPEDGKLPKVTLRFDAVLLTDEVDESRLEPLVDTIEAYTLFHLSDLKFNSFNRYGIFRRKVLKELPFNGNRQEITDFLYMNLFGGQYGAKLKVPDIDVNPQFTGKVHYEGHVATCFQGDFGQDFQPLFTYRYNLQAFSMGIELWQEYIKEGDNQIYIEIIPMRKGSLYDLTEPIILTEEDMQEPYVLQPDESIGYYSISVFAKGQGQLKFGPMHWRYSRMGLGKFILGGNRYNDSKRQEFIYYFNPGDLKPPLTVYFSGFRGAEGFEGFYMMKSLKTPFMLIGDPRLEGGGFYSGTEELEENVIKVIQDSLNYLGFEKNQLILSGLSMGTFGALYNASAFDPYGIVVGKPFANVGDVALGMKLKRPYEFETIGDMLRNIEGDIDQAAIDRLNQRFWNRFDKSDFPSTNFAIAFMEQDDYDGTATEKLVDHLSDKGAHIFTKGYEGRHNDNSRAINRWFMRQYVNMLQEGFDRHYD
ncbi:accessory Sec system protein Asp2 [Streptococcus loxodontisalivarius]|uniref:Accessory secretory protein Asp2 n=1 Tax=Streptococcus loxodontisalivarius TaxID=1349415 RepID=A0ABS2PTV0_9STRE|nr:accessory Sec system protein Asp2 [Streptococcus loxodontisalivarius]MBM7643488.1 accessory secretory protein Asp2 [Streptococcus loxodontisalivarius]